MKPLPGKEAESETWIPLRDKEWLRKYFMVFVYILQSILLVASMKLGIWNRFDIRVTLALLVFVFLMHELLHIAVVYRAGDISLTYHGSILKYSGKVCKINDSTAQCGTYYTTTTPFFERALM